VDVRAECRQIKADRGLDAIGLDHFQLMDGVDGENRTQQLAGVSRKIQGLGHELDVVTFTASQLTLPPSDAHREPQTEDLRECKSLGHDANIVAMLHPYKPSEARSGASVVPFKLLFRKNRGGGLGTVTLNLERDLTRFVPAEPPPPPVRAPKATKASTSVDRVWTGE
jgi:replicative DNA helicase